MSTVHEIEAAIERLSATDFATLAAWFERRQESEWDKQIRADATEGCLDRIWEQELRDIQRQGARPLDELIDNQ